MSQVLFGAIGVGGVHFNGCQACSLKNCTVRSTFKGNARFLATDYRLMISRRHADYILMHACKPNASDQPHFSFN